MKMAENNAPPSFLPESICIKVIPEAAEVAHGGVQPDIEKFLAGSAGNRKAEIGGIAGNIPVR